MQNFTLRCSATALVAGMALSACSGGAMAPSGAGALPNTMPIVMARHTPAPRPGKGCKATQVGYVFGGQCATAQITSTGGNAMLKAYNGYTVKGAFGANDEATKAVFIVRDATGNGDISGTFNSAAWPAFTGSGTAFLYLAVTNTSSSTVTFQATPKIVITNIKHGGFPGTSCTLYALTASGWLDTGVMGTPQSAGKKGRSRVTFPATTLSTAIPFAAGPTYFGFACQ